MRSASTIETDAENRKLKRAIGNVLVDLGEHLLSPIYRRHAGDQAQPPQIPHGLSRPASLTFTQRAYGAHVWPPPNQGATHIRPRTVRRSLEEQVGARVVIPREIVLVQGAPDLFQGSASSRQLQCWPKSHACRQHQQHIRAEIPPSTFHKCRDPRLSDTEIFGSLALSPASLLDVLAQCRHQIGSHLEHAGLSFIKAEIMEHAAPHRRHMTLLGRSRKGDRVCSAK
jgi:hypothetical protein